MQHNRHTDKDQQSNNIFRLKLTFSSDGLNSTEKSGRKITHKEKNH